MTVGELVYETSRQFTLARYVAFHGQALFRSAPGEGGPDRVDVLFRGVQFPAVSTMLMPDFTICELTRDEFSRRAKGFSLTLPSRCICYALGDESSGGLVVALSLEVHRDDHSEWEPSEILEEIS